MTDSLPANHSFKPLWPILLGLLLFALFNLALTAGITFSSLNPRFNFKYGNFLPQKLALLDERTQARHRVPDLLFLGTSQTNHGFVPAVLQRSLATASNGKSAYQAAFNLGLPNNRYDIMQGVLEQHIHRYGKPKLILLELGPSLQERDSQYYYLPSLYYRTLIERDPSLASHWIGNPLLDGEVRKELLTSSLSALRQYRYTFSPLNLLSKVTDKVSAIAQARLAPILEKVTGKAEAAQSIAPDHHAIPDKANLLGNTHTEIASLVITAPAAVIQANNALQTQWSQDGWYAKEASPHMGSPTGVAQSVEEARLYYIASQRAIHFDKLRALLRYCQSQEIPVVLVSWPNHPGMNEAFVQSKLSQDYFNGVRKIQDNFPQIPQIDLNTTQAGDKLTLENAARQGFFADPRHLTPDGARQYTQKLAEQLTLLKL
jgi:hypothetical protein